MTRGGAAAAALWALCLAADAAGGQALAPAVPDPGTGLTFNEDLYLVDISPTVTFNRSGGPPGLPNTSIVIGNNGYGFSVAEPGPEGMLFWALNSAHSSRHTFAKAPILFSPRFGLGSTHLGTVNIYDEGQARLYIEDYATPVIGRNLLRLRNNGPATFRFENGASNAIWSFGSIVADDKFFISKAGASGLDLTLDGAGNLVILGTLTQLSDRNAKRDVVPVDGEALLAKLAALPLSTWSYKADERAARHLGPMAQDFAAAFGFGHDDTHVAPSDVAGVSLAAVQALQRRSAAERADGEREWAAQLAARDAQLAALAARLAQLEQVLAESRSR